MRRWILVAVLSAMNAQARGAEAEAAPTPVPVKSGVVALQPENSSIGFIGTHEGAKPDPRTGGFGKFKGEATVSATGEPEAISFAIETASLWTEFPKLTGHLKSPDFFDVRQHPRAEFESTSIESGEGAGAYTVKGKFTLLGVTKELSIPVQVSSTDDGLTLESKFMLDRTQFGMDYGIGRVKKDVEIRVVVGTPTAKRG